jgi:hypothetical protein
VTTEDIRFRITTWPESPVEPLPVELYRVRPIEGWLSSSPRGQYKLLEPELVLRDLQEVDLFDDPSEVINFLRSHGPITRPFDLFGFAPVPPPEEPWADRVQNHVLEAALYLRTMRATVNHWLNSLEGKDVSEAWSAEAQGGGILHAPYPVLAWEKFAEAMSEGLDKFRVRVEYIVPFEGGSLAWHAPMPDLFSAMCLQLFNIMGEDLPVRHCANEACGRRFFKQSGRSVYGQHRTQGVRFCSRSCARAQVQREYRRRQRSKPQPNAEPSKGMP